MRRVFLTSGGGLAALQGGERGFCGATGHRPRRYDDLELFFVAGADFDKAHAVVEYGYFTRKIQMGAPGGVLDI